MGKHSKNQTSRSYLSSAERAKIAAPQAQRVGSDAKARFDCCGLCLSPLVDAVATPSGFLYCRGCIISNILAQRVEIAGRVAAFEDAEGVRAGAAAAEAMEETEAAAARFVSLEGCGPRVAPLAPGARPIALGGVRARVDPRDDATVREEAKSASPWAPGAEGAGVSVPSAVGRRPETSTRDPLSGGPLRAKDLCRVILRERGGGGAGAEAEAEAGAVASSVAGAPSVVTHGSAASRFECPSCREALALQQTFLSLPCGHVHCSDCVVTVLAKSKACSCGRALSKKDILPLQRAGTAFAASGAR